MEEDTEIWSGSWGGGSPASPEHSSPKARPPRKLPKTQLWSLECLLCPQGRRDQAGGGGQSPGTIKAGPAASGQSQLRAQPSTAMPGPRLAPLLGSPTLLQLLLFSWLPSGGAPSPAQEHLRAFPGPSEIHSSPDVSRFRELRKRYEDLQTRLWLTQSWEDSNPDLILTAQVRILAPKRK